MAVLVLLGLLVVGGTAAIRLVTLDQALLDAALVRAQAGQTTPLSIEQYISIEGSLRVEVLDPGPEAPYAHRRWLAEGRRFLSVPVEQRDLLGEPPAEGHQVIVASAELAPLWADLLRLGVLYVGVCIALVVVVRRRLRRVMAQAMEPLTRASVSALALVEVPTPELQGRRIEGEGGDEVGRFVGVVNTLLDRVEGALDASHRFTGNAAHELRTPLTALRGTVEVALRRPRSAESLRETLEGVHAEALALGELVEGLFTLARLDADGARSGQRSLQAAGALLSEVLDQEGDAGLQVSGAGEDAWVWVDEALVRAALGNLVRNAHKYAGGLVGAAVEVAGDRVRFLLDDAGPGLDQGLDPFERFSRGAARYEVPGLGLGLALVGEVARVHEGSARLEARPEGGTRAILELPRAHAEGG